MVFTHFFSQFLECLVKPHFIFGSKNVFNRNFHIRYSQSHIATDGQSACLSWCRARSGAHDQILIIGLKLFTTKELVHRTKHSSLMAEDQD
jgi:hypothetical protein